MKLGVNISGINKHVGVDGKHQLTPFHGLAQRTAVGDIDQCTTAVERWQGNDFVPLPLRAK
jgi:hypothetical protein